jgi:hypothetical protein
VVFDISVLALGFQHRLVIGAGGHDESEWLLARPGRRCRCINVQEFSRSWPTGNDVSDLVPTV